ncbi:ABC transporter permease [Euzebya sp.]|uniref:ABC transporter permease n=1 Tax=Euzebya sp. TaxID=1971409 RepID=UPI00351855CA
MSTTTGDATGRQTTTERLLHIMRRQEVGLLAVIILLGIAFNMVNDRFITTTNLFNLVQAVTVIGIIAVGQAFVLISKEIDLSVGSVLALSAVCAGWLVQTAGLPAWAAIPGGILVGATSGLVIGVVVVFGKVNSFIVTLGMLSIARGLTQLVTGGLPISMPESIQWLGQGRILGGPPISVVVFVALAIIGQLVLSRTVFGQRVVAVGDNAEAARLGGIPVNRTRVLVFVLVGMLAGLAGVVFATQVGVAEAQAGRGYELDVIAAVVIGGASLSGGRGSIVGAFLGACLLGVLRNAFVLLALSPFLQEFSIGLVIVLAALLDQFRQGNLGSFLRRRRTGPDDSPPVGRDPVDDTTHTHATSSAQ